MLRIGARTVNVHKNVRSGTAVHFDIADPAATEQFTPHTCNECVSSHQLNTMDRP